MRQCSILLKICSFVFFQLCTLTRKSCGVWDQVILEAKCLGLSFPLSWCIGQLLPFCDWQTAKLKVSEKMECCLITATFILIRCVIGFMGSGWEDEAQSASKITRFDPVWLSVYLFFVILQFYFGQQYSIHFINRVYHLILLSSVCNICIYLSAVNFTDYSFSIATFRILLFDFVLYLSYNILYKIHFCYLHVWAV
jgi:hypothetical protein